MVKKQILDWIDSGKYPPGSRLPTEMALPALLGVGKQTVVRVLHDLVRSGRLVRRRGAGTFVAAVGEAPLLPGRDLKIGLLWPQSVLRERLASTLAGRITQGCLAQWGLQQIEPVWHSGAEATRAVWHSAARRVSVIAIGESMTSRQRRPTTAALEAESLDAVVAISVTDLAWLESLLQTNRPLIVVDFPNDRLCDRADHVIVDPAQGYRQAVRYFASRGCRRIFFLGGLHYPPAPTPTMPLHEIEAFQKHARRYEPDSLLRLATFRQALDDLQLPLPESAVHFELFDTDLEAALAQRWLQLPVDERPQAVVCHGIETAERICGLFAQAGVELLAAGATERLTGGLAYPIYVDAARLGSTAAALLVTRLNHAGGPVLLAGVPMRFGVATRDENQPMVRAG